MSTHKLKSLIERALHPGTGKSESETCLRQALKLIDKKAPKRTAFDLTDFKRVINWMAQKNGQWSAWVDSMKLTVKPQNIHGKTLYRFRVGEEEFHELYPTIPEAKIAAEKKAGL